jgi:hypothetical protein
VSSVATQWKDSVRLIATTNVAFSGGTPPNGTAGITIDGKAVAANDRILLLGQTTGGDNGIWKAVSGTPGLWIRETNDGAGSVNELDAGATVMAYDGVTNKAALLRQIVKSPAGFANLQWARQNEVNVRDFGAKGDGSTDDSSAFQVAMNSAAQVGLPLFIPGGVYVIGTPLNPPLSAPLRMLGAGPGKTVLKSTITGGGGNFQSIFYSEPTYSQNQAIANAVTVAPGASSVSVAASVAAGSVVHIRGAPGNSDYGQTRKVKSVTGSGPYTLLLDRPVDQPFVGTGNTATGASVNTVSGRLEEFVVEGVTLTGTGHRYWEILGGFRCRLVDVVLDQSQGRLDGGSGYVASFDVCCLECEYIRVRSTHLTTTSPSYQQDSCLTFEAAKTAMRSIARQSVRHSARSPFSIVSGARSVRA